MIQNNNSQSKESEQEAKLESSGEMIVSGGIQILSLLGSVAVGASGIAFTAVSAASTVLLGAWQLEQQKRFEEKVSQELSTIDEAKLDKKMLESSEFKELVIRICNESQSTASHLKQTALAKGLVNSAFYPSSKLTGKLRFIRTVAQLSDEELHIIDVMQNAWRNNIPVLNEESLQKALVDLDLGQIQEACEGLAQQRILDFVNFGTWTLSRTGRKLVAWLSGEEEQKDFEAYQEKIILQLREELN